MRKPIRGRENIKTKAEILCTAKISAFLVSVQKKERILKTLSYVLRIYIKFDIYLQIF